MDKLLAALRPCPDCENRCVMLLNRRWWCIYCRTYKEIGQ